MRCALLSALLLSSGCAAMHVQERAKVIGEGALGCPEQLTSAWYLAPFEYTIRGCGREVRVDCAQHSAEPTCTSADRVRASNPMVISLFDEFDQTVSQIHSEILACRPNESSFDVTFVLEKKLATKKLRLLHPAVEAAPDWSKDEADCIKSVAGNLMFDRSLRPARIRYTFSRPPEDNRVAVDQRRELNVTE